MSLCSLCVTTAEQKLFQEAQSLFLATNNGKIFIRCPKIFGMLNQKMFFNILYLAKCKQTLSVTLMLCAYLHDKFHVRTVP